MKYSKSLLA